VAHAPVGASAAGNRILAGLAPDDLRLLHPIEAVRFAPRYTVFEAGDALKHIYFPAGAVVSLLQVNRRGAMPEIMLVGADGVAGVGPLLGATSALHRAVVRMGGEAYRVPLACARRAFDASEAFRGLVLRFAELVIRQLSQSVVCKLSHTVEQQLCHRLLAYADHAERMPLELTHEQIAEALGSRRQGITEAACRLQRDRVIAYSRGRISILDRAALERSACECYDVGKNAAG
jgi:CRP-like cAMP-binding protein